MMDNCKLSSLPSDIGSMSNLVNLYVCFTSALQAKCFGGLQFIPTHDASCCRQLGKNYLTSVTNTDAAVTSVLQQLTYL